MACLGNSSALDTSYKTTGVKDKISQFWISELLAKAKVAHQERLSDRSTRDPELNNPSCKGDDRAALKKRIKYRIQQELWDWLVQQPNDFIPLAENDRKHSILITMMSLSWFLALRLGLDVKPGVHYNVLLNTRGICCMSWSTALWLTLERHWSSSWHPRRNSSYLFARKW